MAELSDLYTQELEITCKGIDEAEHNMQTWKEVLDNLTARKSYLKGLRDVDEQLEENELYSRPNAENATRAPRSNKKVKRKTETAILEDLLRSTGPMHARKIVEQATPLGVNFKGSKPPTEMCRDKMRTSKRFHNFGGNVWGLPSQTLPTESNGHTQDAAVRQLKEELPLLGNP